MIFFIVFLVCSAPQRAFGNAVVKAALSLLTSGAAQNGEVFPCFRFRLRRKLPQSREPRSFAMTRGVLHETGIGAYARTPIGVESSQWGFAPCTPHKERRSLTSDCRYRGVRPCNGKKAAAFAAIVCVTVLFYYIFVIISRNFRKFFKLFHRKTAFFS